MADNLYNKFRQYIVYAENLREFCEMWHKPGKITDFNRDADYESHKAESATLSFLQAHPPLDGS